MGRKKVAEGLKVREELVDAWREGSIRLSHTQLMRLADLLARYAQANKKSTMATGQVRVRVALLIALLAFAAGLLAGLVSRALSLL